MADAVGTLLGGMAAAKDAVMDALATQAPPAGRALEAEPGAAEAERGARGGSKLGGATMVLPTAGEPAGPPTDVPPAEIAPTKAATGGGGGDGGRAAPPPDVPPVELVTSTEELLAQRGREAGAA